jgi:hypothetical protein
VNNHIGLLVEHDYVIVFINDIQWDILGQNLFAWQFRQGQLDYICGTYFKAGLDYFAIDLDAAFFDYLLEHNAAEVTEPTMEVFINPTFFD